MSYRGERDVELVLRLVLYQLRMDGFWYLCSQVLVTLFRHRAAAGKYPATIPGAIHHFVVDTV